MKVNEALPWSLFSAGGVAAALFLPALILVTGFILPLSDAQHAAARHEATYAVLAWWLVRLVLLAVIALSFMHCAHRIRHTAADLGLRGAGPWLSAVCYGGGVVGVIATLWVLLRL